MCGFANTNAERPGLVRLIPLLVLPVGYRSQWALGWARGRRPPSALHWREIVRVLEQLGAEHLGDKGDHKRYRLVRCGKVYPITVPTYKDISGDLLASIISQTGLRKKAFWDIYSGLDPIRETAAEE